MTNDRLLKPAEVAEMLGVHRDTISEWLREGVLPGLKLPGAAGWRVRASALSAWLEARESGTESVHNLRLPTPEEAAALHASETKTTKRTNKRAEKTLEEPKE